MTTNTKYPNIFVALKAPPKAGKTYFACTFPDPIVIYSLDGGAEYIARQFPSKKITVRDFRPPILDSSKPIEAEVKLLEEFEAQYRLDIASGEFVTAVIDPASILWELNWHTQQVEEGDARLVSRKYAEPNARMMSYFNRPIQMGMNLVSINYLKEVYANDKPTGELKLDGFKRTESQADVVVQLERVRRGGQNAILATITDSRYDGLNVTGLTLTNPTYEDLMTVLGL
jgi:hypothetical protein